MKMERKLIGLVLVALLIGLGGGYGLGFVIYQPQIQDLRNNLDNLNGRLDTINSTLQEGMNRLSSNFEGLNSTVEIMENRTWHEAFYIESSGDVTTNTFLIKGKWTRIRWAALGEYSGSWILIGIYFANGTLYTSRGSSGVLSSYACDLEIPNPNEEYFLNITAYAMDQYLVCIWDYY